MEEEKIKTEIKEKEHKVKVENIKDEIKEETVIKKVKKDIKVNDKDLLDKLTFKKEDIKGTQNKKYFETDEILNLTNNDNNEDVIIEAPENIEQGGEDPNSDLETMIEIKEE